MHFKTKSPIFFAVVLLLSLTSTLGLPAQFEDRAVYNPHITSPKAGDMFITGSTTTITWDISAIPADSHNKGMLVLGYLEGDDSNEHLDIEHPLASGFQLRAGSQTVTFPSHLPTRDGYIVVLFGDSGNKSPQFTIKAYSYVM